MGISGNLKTMQLAELLQWLSMGQKVGTLVIEKGPPSNVVKRIFFDEGVIISSASTDPGEYLGRFLVSHGYLAEDAVNEAISRQKEEQQMLGRILVGMNLIQEEDLHQMLRLKAEESIYDIFTWDEGAFEFFDSDLPSENMVRMELDVQWIVLEGTRRTDEWKRIQAIIPSPLCVPVTVTDLAQVELEEFDRSILAWINDDRTVEEISQGTMTNLFQVSDILAKQVQAGLIKVVRPRIIETEVPVIQTDEEEAVQEEAAPTKIDPNESGAFFLPMMQQMMAQYQQQQMQMMGQPGQVPAQPVAINPPQPAAAPPVDLGGGRQLSFARPAAPMDSSGSFDRAPIAAQPASMSVAEGILQEGEAALKRGDLVAAVTAFRKAPTAIGGDAVKSRAEQGEEKVVQALESRGVNLSRVPRLKCGMDELTKLDISPQEGFMLTRVDGSYDIKSILRISPLPKVDALLLFWKLREAGHVAL